MNPIWLINFPLPPSVNEYLMPVAGPLSRNRKGKLYQTGRFVKTEQHRIYRKMCFQWKMLNNLAWQKIQDELQNAVKTANQENKKIAFMVDTYFIFEDSRLWTKSNAPQRLDADNRLKPCRDALSELLSIDDKYFFGGFFEKLSTSEKDQECTYIRISQMTPRTLQNLKMEIKKEREKAS